MEIPFFSSLVLAERDCAYSHPQSTTSTATAPATTLVLVRRILRFCTCRCLSFGPSVLFPLPSQLCRNLQVPFFSLRCAIGELFSSIAPCVPLGPSGEVQ